MVLVELGVVDAITLLRGQLSALVGLEIAPSHEDALDTRFGPPDHFREDGGRCENPSNCN